MLNRDTVASLAMQGHTIHPDRSQYTHAQFWGEVKDLPDETVVKYKGEPVEMKYLGRALTVGDMLPERRALALNADGEVVAKNEFKERWRLYQRGFNTNRDPNLEPVPNLLEYIKAGFDPCRPPENGRAWYVEIGFDSRSGGEAKITEEWHPDGIKMKDWLRDNPQAVLDRGVDENAARIRELVSLMHEGTITPETLANRVAALAEPAAGGNGEAVLEETEQPEAPEAPEYAPEQEADPAPVAASGPKGKEATPCGELVTKGYFKQHQRFCKKPECQAAGAEVS